MKKRVVSTRLDINELAKCRDGLITRGISTDHLNSVSQILRAAVYLAIADCEMPGEPATETSTALINQLMSKTKMTKSLSIDDIPSE